MTSNPLDVSNDQDVILLSDDEDTKIVVSPKHNTEALNLKRKRHHNQSSNENADTAINSTGSQDSKNLKKDESTSAKKQPLLTATNSNGRKASSLIINSTNTLKQEDQNALNGVETIESGEDKLVKKMNIDAEGLLFLF